MRQFIIVIEKYTKNDGNQNINGSTSMHEKVCLKIIPFFAFTPHTGKLENKFPARMSVMEAKTVALSIFKAH